MIIHLKRGVCLFGLLFAACGPRQGPVSEPRLAVSSGQCSVNVARAHLRRATMKQEDEGVCSSQCAAGDPSGCVALGLLHLDGTLVTKDEKRAAMLFESACTAGYAPGCAQFGGLLEVGAGVAKEKARATSFYMKACSGGDAFGCFHLGRALDQGIGVAKDEALAVTRYSQACDGGDARGCFNLGVALSLGIGGSKDEARAATLYKKACDGSEPFGCFNLGVAFSLGSGVVRDETRAASLFATSCAAGVAEGCLKLGLALEQGAGVDKDEARAAAFLAKACGAGDVHGCLHLGHSFAHGVGVAKDEARAVTLYTKACDDGSTQACVNVGVALSLGAGVARDDARAARLLAKACKRGDPLGCYYFTLLFRARSALAEVNGTALPDEVAQPSEQGPKRRLQTAPKKSASLIGLMTPPPSGSPPTLPSRWRALPPPPPPPLPSQPQPQPHQPPPKAANVKENLDAISEKVGPWIAAASVIATWDSNVRINRYVKPAEELAKKIFEDLKNGDISHMEGRENAHEGRNKLLESSREKLSLGGKALSKAIKEEGKPLAELVEKYSVSLLKEHPDLMKKYGLKTVEKGSRLFNAAKYQAAINALGNTAEVSRLIIDGAGRPRGKMTVAAKIGKILGPVGIVTSAGFSLYEVGNAPEGEKLHTAGREVSSFAGGMLGSVGGGLVAGWTASLACGPGMAVCAVVVTVVFVGGASYYGSEAGEAAFEAATRGGGAGGGPPDDVGGGAHGSYPEGFPWSTGNSDDQEGTGGNDGPN